MKKLGYYSELENLDRNLCKLVNKMEGCNMEKAMETLLESLNVDSRYFWLDFLYFEVNSNMKVRYDEYLVTEDVIIED